MSLVTVRTIKLFGDHPVLDFTNTVNSRGVDFGPDVLTGFRDLLHWGVRVGIIDAATENALRNVKAKRGEAALSHAKALREVLYRIFVAQPSAAAADLDLLQQEVLAAQPCGCSGRKRAALPGVGVLAIRIRSHIASHLRLRICLPRPR